jgi:transcriptional regulator with XRE-family HTH domain
MTHVERTGRDADAVPGGARRPGAHDELARAAQAAATAAEHAVLEAFDPVPIAFASEVGGPRLVVDVSDAAAAAARLGVRSSTAGPVEVFGSAAGAATPPIAGAAGSAGDLGADTDPLASDHGYQRRLGERLRAVRRSHGMRLQDVEERSGGRFKAVVIGSYERGDRAIATHKLAALAAFYGVPIGELLPDDGWPEPAPPTQAGIRLSVAAVQNAGDDTEVVALRRVVQHVRALRSDHHGQVLTLRGDDLRTVAITLGVDVSELPEWLAARGLLATT